MSHVWTLILLTIGALALAQETPVLKSPLPDIILSKNETVVLDLNDFYRGVNLSFSVPRQTKERVAIQPQVKKTSTFDFSPAFSTVLNFLYVPGPSGSVPGAQIAALEQKNVFKVAHFENETQSFNFTSTNLNTASFLPNPSNLTCFSMVQLSQANTYIADCYIQEEGNCTNLFVVIKNNDTVSRSAYQEAMDCPDLNKYKRNTIFTSVNKVDALVRYSTITPNFTIDVFQVQGQELIRLYSLNSTNFTQNLTETNSSTFNLNALTIFSSDLNVLVLKTQDGRLTTYIFQIRNFLSNVNISDRVEIVNKIEGDSILDAGAYEINGTAALLLVGQGKVYYFLNNTYHSTFAINIAGKKEPQSVSLNNDFIAVSMLNGDAPFMYIYDANEVYSRAAFSYFKDKAALYLSLDKAQNRLLQVSNTALSVYEIQRPKLTVQNAKGSFDVTLSINALETEVTQTTIKIIGITDGSTAVLLSESAVGEVFRVPYSQLIPCDLSTLFNGPFLTYKISAQNSSNFLTTVFKNLEVSSAASLYPAGTYSPRVIRISQVIQQSYFYMLLNNKDHNTEDTFHVSNCSVNFNRSRVLGAINLNSCKDLMKLNNEEIIDIDLTSVYSNIIYSKVSSWQYNVSFYSKDFAVQRQFQLDKAMSCTQVHSMDVTDLGVVLLFCLMKTEEIQVYIYDVKSNRILFGKNTINQASLSGIQDFHPQGFASSKLIPQVLFISCPSYIAVVKVGIIPFSSELLTTIVPTIFGNHSFNMTMSQTKLVLICTEINGIEIHDLSELDRIYLSRTLFPVPFFGLRPVFRVSDKGLVYIQGFDNQGLTVVVVLNPNASGNNLFYDYFVLNSTSAVVFDVADIPEEGKESLSDLYISFTPGSYSWNANQIFLTPKFHHQYNQDTSMPYLSFGLSITATNKLAQTQNTTQPTFTSFSPQLTVTTKAQNSQFDLHNFKSPYSFSPHDFFSGTIFELSIEQSDKIQLTSQVNITGPSSLVFTGIQDFLYTNNTYFVIQNQTLSKSSELNKGWSNITIPSWTPSINCKKLWVDDWMQFGVMTCNNNETHAQEIYTVCIEPKLLNPLDITSVRKILVRNQTVFAMIPADSSGVFLRFFNYYADCIRGEIINLPAYEFGVNPYNPVDFDVFAHPCNSNASDTCYAILIIDPVLNLVAVDMKTGTATAQEIEQKRFNMSSLFGNEMKAFDFQKIQIIEGEWNQSDGTLSLTLLLRSKTDNSYIVYLDYKPVGNNLQTVKIQSMQLTTLYNYTAVDLSDVNKDIYAPLCQGTVPGDESSLYLFIYRLRKFSNSTEKEYITPEARVRISSNFDAFDKDDVYQLAAVGEDMFIYYLHKEQLTVINVSRNLTLSWSDQSIQSFKLSASNDLSASQVTFLLQRPSESVWKQVLLFVSGSAIIIVAFIVFLVVRRQIKNKKIIKHRKEEDPLYKILYDE